MCIREVKTLVVEVKKKDGESVESLLRRFTKKVQQSGVLLRAKRSRFFEPPRSKRAIRASAIRRSEIKVRKDFLRKIGKLEEYNGRRKPNRRPLPRLSP